MYSQGQEEAAILKYFGDKKDGRFLDIGAYDGKTFSNTLALAERGWTGVCVEPSPLAFVALQQQHKDRAVKLVSVAVTSVEGPGSLIKFYDTPDAVGTVDVAHMEKWKQAVPYREIWVTIMGVKNLIEVFPGPYDFINVDVEGISLHVAKAIFDHCEAAGWSPGVICIEHDGHHVELCNRGRGWGYQPIYLDGNNLILAK